LGFDILKQLSEEDSTHNLFISPLSLSTVLTMVACGSTERSATHEGLKTVLHQERIQDEEIEQHFEKLLLSTTADPTKKDEGVQCTLAQSAWVKEGVDTRTTIKEEYKNMVRRCFQAEVLPLTSAEGVNRWCAEKTRGMITEIMTRVPYETRLILVNAVYFKGTWKVSFDKELTREERFTTSQGKINVPMMYQKRDDFLFYEKEGLFEMIQLDYGTGDRFCATILLPNPIINAYEFLEKMNANDWTSWRNSLGCREGSLHLPRMKVRYGVKSMRGPLCNLGMGVAFSSTDFERMGKGICLSDILHTTVIEMDEEGTTAAAVSAATMMKACLFTAARPFVMKVDRPFLFFISTKAGDLLFAGCIDKPI